MEKEYNVAYDDDSQDGHIYCLSWMDLETAEKYRQICIDRYVGKAFPNGKGFYSIKNVRIIERNK